MTPWRCYMQRSGSSPRRSDARSSWRTVTEGHEPPSGARFRDAVKTGRNSSKISSNDGRGNRRIRVDVFSCKPWSADRVGRRREKAETLGQEVTRRVPPPATTPTTRPFE